jgi:hypothetical protein
MAINRTSNTEIVGFLEVGNRSIISIRYRDAPQWRLPNGRLRQRLPPVRYANEPQTLELLGVNVKTQPTELLGRTIHKMNMQ